MDKLRNSPYISIIIPTLNSGKYLETTLVACFSQGYPKERFEVIIADNNSKDNTIEIAKKFGAKVLTKSGKPSQACSQRNIGAEEAKGCYVYFVDHDMEMSADLLAKFAEGVKKTDGKVDAWYVPERIKASSWLLEKIRNFERTSYNGTIIDSARIIKKLSFFKTEKYDLKMQTGPADWDMDNQLREINAKWGVVDSFVYHHEESMSFWQYIKKKSIYVKECIVYQDKWKARNRKLYNKIIRRQFQPLYRLFSVFFEGDNWKRTILSPLLFICLFFVRFLVGVAYFFKGISYRLSTNKAVDQ